MGETEASINGVDISPNKDGGVIKEIIKEGTSSDSPSTGDTVYVHYVGKLLDGTVFDSSRDRGEKFEFTLGTGNVIKGWDIAVATMKRGELSNLTCKSEYAYGAAGSPPNIPPNATLVFEVELLGWQMEDLSPKKNGGIQRRILTKGEDYSSPKDGSTVDIHYIGQYEDKTFEEKDIKFIIGEGPEKGIVSGLEIAIQQMKKGEISLIKLTGEYGYGSEGKPELNIPSNANLTYTVTLKSFEKLKEAWELNSIEKLEQSEIAKTKGTDYFKEGRYKLAEKQYKRILTLIENNYDAEEDSKEKRQNLVLAAHLNLAACYLKTKEPLEASKAAEKALEIDPQNVKGLFRKGQAQSELKNYDIAMKDFEAVLKVDPKNKAARNQIIICTKNLKQELEKEKRTYQNMFTKFAEEDTRKEAMKGLQSTESGVWQNGQKSEIGDKLEHSDLENVELLSSN